MAMNKRLMRVKKLAKYWETVAPETVKLSTTWVCGTHACLGGHAAQMSEFNAEGFVASGLPWPSRNCVKYGIHLGLSACEKFFGQIDLFLPRYEPEILYGYMSDWQLAATRMREYLYKRGVRY